MNHVCQFTKNLSKANFKSDRLIAIALSGGPDSMALCHQLANSSNAEIHALTVDHSLRPESAAEAAKIGSQIAKWRNVRHEILIVSRETIGERIMEGARDARYAVMATYCAAHGITQLFTAHHLDDQAETVLFRLAKGSGPDGLAGMRAASSYNEHLTLMRPLLQVPKADLIAYCQDHKIPYVEDPTNQNPIFARNRLRQSAKILAREGLTAKRLTITAARMARACDALDHYAQSIFLAARHEYTAQSLTLDFAILQSAPAEIRLRVLLLAMTSLIAADEFGYGPRREKLEKLSADLFANEPFRKRTLGGFIFTQERQKNLLFLTREQSLKSL